MNRVVLTGRATKDIELRYTPSGKAVCKGTIAVQRKFKNAQNEYDTDFIDFFCWGRGGEVMAEYIKKGDFFGIDGEWHTRIWEKDDGSKVKLSEVNVNQFDFPIKKAASSHSSSDNPPPQINDDDLPF